MCNHFIHIISSEMHAHFTRLFLWKWASIWVKLVWLNCSPLSICCISWKWVNKSIWNPFEISMQTGWKIQMKIWVEQTPCKCVIFSESICIVKSKNLRFHVNLMKNPNENLGRANSLQVCNLFRVYLYSEEQKFEISCQLDEKSKWKLGLSKFPVSV